MIISDCGDIGRSELVLDEVDVLNRELDKKGCLNHCEFNCLLNNSFELLVEVFNARICCTQFANVHGTTRNVYSQDRARSNSRSLNCFLEKWKTICVLI